MKRANKVLRGTIFDFSACFIAHTLVVVFKICQNAKTYEKKPEQFYILFLPVRVYLIIQELMSIIQWLYKHWSQKCFMIMILNLSCIITPLHYNSCPYCGCCYYWYYFCCVWQSLPINRKNNKGISSYREVSVESLCALTIHYCHQYRVPCVVGVVWHCCAGSPQPPDNNTVDKINSQWTVIWLPIGVAQSHLHTLRIVGAPVCYNIHYWIAYPYWHVQ